ncbi:MBOAT family O-acyltransferase [Aurantibacillus circumpalustris]|uniref:MBOAT family O-acyltransferase n=1 Tax=Aurantibacillus circumpalustris TaxID=3036359 RepID=UPI00295B80E1|nr:MBOAT family O-acyltransferase [Aurantibacillus circumpalustris]
MLFNSFDFLFYFSVVFLSWLVTPINFRWVVLLCASLVFYGWEKPTYLILLALTISITYYSAIKMDEYKKVMVKKRVFLYSAMVVNLGILIVFKYLGFFTDIYSQLANLLSFGLKIPPLKLLLPIGISFYTFQSIGYSLDVFFGLRKPEKHLGYFALFVSFFPQILSGPIGRSSELFPQIHTPQKFSWDNIGYGIQRFVWGLFKKIVIADRLDVYVNDIYSNISHYPGSVLWLGTFLFAFQLYTDFSAYTDMAIGVARFFGFKLAENFDFPFISKNVTEFWRRWHMSLSAWLRDYMYTPLQFSKRKWKKGATVYAIFLTFFICGLWHGAKFTFVLFGIIQGLALTYEMLTREKRQLWSKTFNPFLYNTFSWLLTFGFTLLSFVFFRAESTEDAFLLIRKQFTTFSDVAAIKIFVMHFGGIKFAFSLLLLLFFILTDKLFSTMVKLQNRKSFVLTMITSLLIVFIILFGTFGKVDFIYFQF